MITSLLLVAAVLLLPTIVVLGALFLLGSAVVAIAEGASVGFVRSETTAAEPA